MLFFAGKAFLARHPPGLVRLGLDCKYDGMDYIANFYSLVRKIKAAFRKFEEQPPSEVPFLTTELIC